MVKSTTKNQKVKKIRNAAQIIKTKKHSSKDFELKMNFIVKPISPQRKTLTDFKEPSSSKRADVVMKKSGLNHKSIISKRNYLRTK